ncbi:hypothetical protein JXA47_01160, partial [Candidatus Sumerlaeota bacterium]|nr:hypothetical protein [Candidatus Sumerlaeota bacterium]
MYFRPLLAVLLSIPFVPNPLVAKDVFPTYASPERHFPGPGVGYWPSDSSWLDIQDEALVIRNSVLMGDGRGEGLRFIQIGSLQSSAELRETETKFLHYETVDSEDDPTTTIGGTFYRYVNFALERACIMSGFDDELDTAADRAWDLTGRIFIGFVGQAGAIDNPADNTWTHGAATVQRTDEFMGIAAGASITPIRMVANRFTTGATASPTIGAYGIPEFGNLTGVYANTSYHDTFDASTLGAISFGKVPTMIAGNFEAIPTMRLLDDYEGIPGSNDLAVGVRAVVDGRSWDLYEGMTNTTLADEQAYNVLNAIGGLFSVFAAGEGCVSSISEITTAYGIYVGDPLTGVGISGDYIANAYGIYIAANNISSAGQHDDWSLYAEGDIAVEGDTFLGYVNAGTLDVDGSSYLGHVNVGVLDVDGYIHSSLGNAILVADDLVVQRNGPPQMCLTDTDGENAFSLVAAADRSTGRALIQSDGDLSFGATGAFRFESDQGDDFVISLTEEPGEVEITAYAVRIDAPLDVSDSILNTSGPVVIDDSLDIDDGTFYVDAASNRIGWNTTTPAAYVDFYHTANNFMRWNWAQLQVRGDSANNATLQIESNGTAPSLRVLDGGQETLVVEDGGDLVFRGVLRDADSDVVIDDNLRVNDSAGVAGGLSIGNASPTEISGLELGAAYYESYPSGDPIQGDVWIYLRIADAQQGESYELIVEFPDGHRNILSTSGFTTSSSAGGAKEHSPGQSERSERRP